MSRIGKKDRLPRTLGSGRAKRFDLTNMRFGRLVAIHEVGKIRRNYHWFCRCDCGGDAVVKVQSLTCGGTTKSCGCLQPEAASKANTTHGCYLTGEYGVWLSMRQRCNNPNAKQYRDYGGRGIRVCPQWNCPDGFAAFIAHVGKRPTPRHLLDRIENDKGYEPGNIRWTVRAVQNRNTRRTRFFTFRGETKCITDWARHFGIAPGIASSRLRMGWPFIKAMTWPTRERPTIELQGKRLTPTQWSKITGIPATVIRSRILKLGWKPARALSESSHGPRRFLAFRGQNKTAHQWGLSLGISPNTIIRRLREGWSIEKTLTTPVSGLRALTFRGETLSPKEWSKRTGLGMNTILFRIKKKGWSVEKTLTTPLLRVRKNARQMHLDWWKETRK